MNSFVILSKYLTKFLPQIDINGQKTDATVDDIIKIVEDLTRIH